MNLNYDDDNQDNGRSQWWHDDVDNEDIEADTFTLISSRWQSLSLYNDDWSATRLGNARAEGGRWHELGDAQIGDLL